MSNPKHDEQISRRKFLTAAAATAVAATAAGAGAAAIIDRNSAPAQAVLPPINTPIPSANSVVIPNPTPESLSQLASLQADNVRLRADLDAALRRVSTYENAGNAGAEVNADLQLQLGEANQQIGVLGGLIALYEQLEESPVGSAIADGFDFVDDAMGDLIDKLPEATAGFALGRAVLESLENDVPLLEGARNWLVLQIGRLESAYDAVENVLRGAADAAAPFLSMLNEWFEKMLGWLPFGLGETSLNIMNEMTSLLSEIPETVNGVADRVNQPFDKYLMSDGRGVPLVVDVIQPVRDEAITKGETTIAAAEAVCQTYDNQLVAPARAALEQEQLIRVSIETYRQINQI